jgi:hypothetical protein
LLTGFALFGPQGDGLAKKSITHLLGILFPEAFQAASIVRKNRILNVHFSGMVFVCPSGMLGSGNDRAGSPRQSASKRAALETHKLSDYEGVERRRGRDRRRPKRVSLKHLLGKGTRRSSRRAIDRERIVLFDQYPRSLFTGAIFVLLFSLLDAVLTLVLIAEGATELNPIMLYYLGKGPIVFLLVKYGLTVLSLLIIVVSYEALLHRYKIGATLLPLFATLFGGVILWELYLLSLL